MKIVVAFNRQSKNVINLFGVPNREKYGRKAIKRILDSLKEGDHQAIALEADKDLIDRLEEFMPRVLKGERPGLVFNLSYGIQGQARYTHVPGMLEMVGIPYVGSNPLAHSLALDKVVAKMIFKQSGIPTPDFVVLEEPGFPAPDLEYPLIVKPKNEAVSFGIKIVNNEEELRAGADAIFEKFEQPVLAERYIEGREINVGLLGNNPPEAFPPAELVFGGGGPNIYTYEDKTHRSGREVGVKCPADLSPELTEKAKDISRRAFAALGCYDCARVDMRMDGDGNLYVLEINSLPSLGEHGSYVSAAEAIGLNFAGLVNRLVEVASARYFGTPSPPDITAGKTPPKDQLFGFLTARRDRIEKRVQDWTTVQSRTSDPVGIRGAIKKVDKRLTELGLKAKKEFTNEQSAWAWETPKGMAGGTLLVAHVDVPLPQDAARIPFRRDPENLHGEGIGASRAPLVMTEYALAALRSVKQLKNARIGVLIYSDEGRDARYSGDLIRAAAEKAKQVLVLRPGLLGDNVVTRRRGRLKYQFTAEQNPRRPGSTAKGPSVFHWTTTNLSEISKLTSRKDLLSISVLDFRTTAWPLLLPHRIEASLLMTYLDPKKAAAVEQKIRAKFGKDGIQWDLNEISNRPPMKERRGNQALFNRLKATADQWEVPLAVDSSAWPSVAGLIPASTPVVCGMGPVALNLYTPDERVQRISLIQRTLLLAHFLLEQENA